MRRFFLPFAVFASLIWVHGSPLEVEAAVKPSRLFSDNVVLQQGTKAPVWGIADPGEKVTVRFDGQEVSATAAANGKWLVHLNPLKAGGPFEMTITGSNTITLKNVLVGEVWVCSGQSNMEWTVQACGREDLMDAKAAPSNPQLRMFKVAKRPQEKPVDDVSGSWVEAAPNSVPSFSAVGYYFAKEIHEKLKVPVGIIDSSWGGTRAEAWTSRPALRRLGADYDKMVEAHETAFEKNPKVANNPNAPSTLYNGMIAPLLPYAISGSIWYQGESNAGQAHAYGRLFPGMIQNWRDDWHMPKMPFYFVQLAPFTRVQKDPGESTWAELRESQRQTLKLPYTGMAVITDLGHEADIHPTPKKPVGLRLAWIALEDTYHQKMADTFSQSANGGVSGIGQFENNRPTPYLSRNMFPFSMLRLRRRFGDRCRIVYSDSQCVREYQTASMKAPDLLRAEFANGKATLTTTATGLVAHELVPTDERKNKEKSLGFGWRVKEGSTGGAEVLGFTIAGSDRKFHAAQAKLENKQIIVWCDQVPEPVAVRYGWSNHPICTVFGTNGIPMTPFRTDDFRFTTAPKETK